MALAAQTIYLEKLQKFLKDDLAETESKLKGNGTVDTILEKQLKRLQGEINFTRKCVDLLKSKPIPTYYVLNLNKTIEWESIPFGDQKTVLRPCYAARCFLTLAGDNLKLII